MYLPRSLISLLYNNLLKTTHPLSPPVLILPALEPDAICACRIFTALLKRDYIPHKIHPVSGYADLNRVGEELVRPMKTSEGGSGGVVICLGVGGLVDLAELLGLEDETEGADPTGGIEVWVLDARRPWNLTNVFGGVPTLNSSAQSTAVSRPRATGIDKGCIQRSFRPGKGGVIVFDDGDIAEELSVERDAYCTLADMPEVDYEAEDSDDEEEGDHNQDEPDPGSRKRKSWSDRDDVGSESDDDERPRQRRRSNSGSSIVSSRQRTPTSSSPTRSAAIASSPPQLTAKQLRKKLAGLRRSHEKTLQEYYRLGTSYSEPISSLAYSLASELGREDNDLLWLAIVGVTSLELSGHTSTGLGTSNYGIDNSAQHRGWRVSRSSRTYALLRDEVRRLNPSTDRSFSSSSRPTSASASDTSIQTVPDPRFMLLRHWSLYDSMCHSPYLAARLHVWNESGKKRLHKLLAKMGFSLKQCKQVYVHMDVGLRAKLRRELLKFAGLYGLEDLVPAGEGQTTYDQEGWGFVRNWGWKAQLSAVDVGVILGAILEVGGSSTTSAPIPAFGSASSLSRDGELEVQDRSAALLPRFFAAYDALAPSHPNRLLAAIPQAQHLLRSIFRTGSSLLAKHQIRHLRAFRMGVVKDGPDLSLFSNSPGALVKLALWVGEAVSISEKDKKGSDLATPLVLAALDEARGTYVVVGTGGGIGGGQDVEARKEKAEAKAKKEAVREQKRKVREEKRAARRAQRELNGDSDVEDDDSDESEDSADESDDDDEDLQHNPQKRGHGRNRFGIAFQEVVEETNARVKIDSFDHCVVEVKKEDLAGFLEGLSLKNVVAR